MKWYDYCDIEKLKNSVLEFIRLEKDIQTLNEEKKLSRITLLGRLKGLITEKPKPKEKIQPSSSVSSNLDELLYLWASIPTNQAKNKPEELLEEPRHIPIEFQQSTLPKEIDKENDFTRSNL